MSHVFSGIEETADFNDSCWGGLVADGLYFSRVGADAMSVDDETEEADFWHERMAFQRLQLESVVVECFEYGGCILKVSSPVMRKYQHVVEQAGDI